MKKLDYATIVNYKNVDKFSDTFEKHLARRLEENPMHYRYRKDSDTHKRVVKLHRIAFKAFAESPKDLTKGNFDKTTGSICDTCKELGIKNTFKSIKEFFHAKD
ncbi:hypothetical protein phi1422_0036 [Bdellovibrio phage phi1422]|uniref:hypothetical protein n=1 Tax=Bdellovibrio phage phi1422 TaxID=1127515 RepID=UPI0002536D58|nr:hypothetical protein F395_gp36 [Bdellovibrio phage phi1422]AFC22556.1 hypothetical protein phi1422_0036 [Bdellovibrio phage phi1422]